MTTPNVNSLDNWEDYDPEAPIVPPIPEPGAEISPADLLKAAKGEAELPTEPSPDPEPEPVAQPGPDPLSVRVDDLTRKNVELEERYHRLMERQLDEGKVSSPDGDPLEQVDQGVVELVGPVVRNELKSGLSEVMEFVNTFAPVLRKVAHDQAEDGISEVLTGYQDMKPEVKQLYDSLPPEEQSKYDSDVGAMALYGRILDHKMRTQKAQTSTGKLKQEVQTESRQTHVASHETKPEDIDWVGMDDAEFDKVDEYLQNMATRSPGGRDPLLG